MRRFKVAKLIKWQIEIQNTIFQFAICNNLHKEWSEKMNEGIIVQAGGVLPFIKKEETIEQ